MNQTVDLLFWQPYIKQLAAIAVANNLDMNNDNDFDTCLWIFDNTAYLN